MVRLSTPVVIGLTGSIGCGKSTVMQTLVALGALGIDADQVAHAVMLPGAPAYATVIEEFGPSLLGPGGQIDRRILGQRVFADPAALERLERIIHPAVGDAIRSQVKTAGQPMVVIEAIKLLEAGLSSALCDEVWVVTCPPDQQMERLASTRGMSGAEVERRLAAQMPPAEMVAHADRIVDASGTVTGTALQALAAWVALGLPLPAPQTRPANLHDAEGLAEVLNAVIREGGLTVLDRPVSVDEERAFLKALPSRARLTVVTTGPLITGFQVIEPYAAYTRAMDHVAKMGTYLLPVLRGANLGRALAAATRVDAREAGFEKIVVNVRADNPNALDYYISQGFKSCGRLARQACIDGHYVDELLYELFLSQGEVG